MNSTVLARRLGVAGGRERRWVIIGTDGRHVIVGRHSDPTDAEIAASEESLKRQGLAGWLVVTEGDYWSQRSKLTVMMVRPLASPASAFETALEAFESARLRAHRPT